ncbi:MAG: hypothetical protein ACOX2E_10140 [Syntrophaceticus sp.]|jgi:hypothetical protein
MAKKKKSRTKAVKPRQTDVETASEYITVDDLKRKAIAESEQER